MSSAILVLDDDRWLADIYRETLVRRGYEVHYASRAQDALDLLDQHPQIDLGLIDLMLRGPNGISFLYEVLSELDWQNKRFIVMSHHHRREVCDDPSLWSQLNVHDFLYKPHLQPDDLVRAVERAYA